MRPLIWFWIAILTCSEAVAQSLEPDVVVLPSLSDVLPGRPGGAHGHLDYNKFVAPEGRRKLGAFIRDCITRSYSQKELNDGIYVSDAVPDDTLNDLPGVRVRAIVPSELFRDSNAYWDDFEVVAAVEAPEFVKGGAPVPDAKGRLWILAMNYRYRGRGGITISGPRPSPDWEYSSLMDRDSTNGRLRKIQDGIKQEAEARGKQEK